MMKGYGKERTQVEFPRFLQLCLPTLLETRAQSDRGVRNNMLDIAFTPRVYCTLHASGDLRLILTIIHTPAAHLGSLPLDVLHALLARLDPRDLGRCMPCRAFRETHVPHAEALQKLSKLIGVPNHPLFSKVLAIDERKSRKRFGRAIDDICIKSGELDRGPRSRHEWVIGQYVEPVVRYLRKAVERMNSTGESCMMTSLYDIVRASPAPEPRAHPMVEIECTPRVYCTLHASGGVRLLTVVRTPAAHLGSLPLDVLHALLARLDPRDLGRCMPCRAFRETHVPAVAHILNTCSDGVGVYGPSGFPLEFIFLTQELWSSTRQVIPPLLSTPTNEALVHADVERAIRLGHLDGHAVKMCWAGEAKARWDPLARMQDTAGAPLYPTLERIWNRIAQYSLANGGEEPMAYICHSAREIRFDVDGAGHLLKLMFTVGAFRYDNDRMDAKWTCGSYEVTCRRRETRRYAGFVEGQRTANMGPVVSPQAFHKHLGISPPPGFETCFMALLTAGEEMDVAPYEHYYDLQPSNRFGLTHGVYWLWFEWKRPPSMEDFDQVMMQGILNDLQHNVAQLG